MRKWTEDEEEYLKESYPLNITIEEMCKKLKRTYDSIMSKKKTMFLKRSKSNKQYKEQLFSIDWSNIDECSFYVEKHKSALKNKLYMTLNR